MIKFVGVAICTLLCAIFIKNYSKTFSIILSIIGVSIMFLLVADKISDIVEQLLSISQGFKASYQYVKLMIKVLGITLISQFISDLCRENGEVALSSIVLLTSKITVISIMLPLFEVVINIVIGLVK